MRTTPARIRRFRTVVYKNGGRFRREFPWRRSYDPYRVLVSEVMLQQTQADRVAVKFPAFVKRFPSIRALDRASLADVVAAWHGLGYNRRALNLKRAAREVVTRYRGRIPDDPALLRKIPGIGAYTAAAVSVFAYRKPCCMMETNIRSVLLHHFFPRSVRVADKKLIPVLTAALDRRNPRRWYEALMDYGTVLKKQAKNPSKRSAHYRTQSGFAGSNRELRGIVIGLLIRRRRLTIADFGRLSKRPVVRIAKAVRELSREGLVTWNGKYATLGVHVP